MLPAHDDTSGLSKQSCRGGDLGQAETAALLTWARDLCLQLQPLGLFAVFVGESTHSHLCSGCPRVRTKVGHAGDAAEPMPGSPHGPSCS